MLRPFPDLPPSLFARFATLPNLIEWPDKQGWFTRPGQTGFTGFTITGELVRSLDLAYFGCLGLSWLEKDQSPNLVRRLSLSVEQVMSSEHAS